MVVELCRSAKTAIFAGISGCLVFGTLAFLEALLSNKFYINKRIKKSAMRYLIFRLSSLNLDEI